MVAPTSDADPMPPREQEASNSDLSSRLDTRFRGPLMTFFMRRIRDRAEAEDLTQDTLLRVLRAHALERVENAESYVFKVATNLLRDRKRHAPEFHGQAFIPIDEALAGELEHQLLEDLTPERVLLSRASLQEVLGLLQELNPRTRNIFVLFRLENMKQKDIAALYGIGQSTVEKHVMKAVLHLATRHGGTRCR
jgi:RNA polymerase sigma-70 factor (ECF subfamily)